MMKLHSESEETVIYYERGAYIYELIRCREESEPEFYVVRDKESNPLLASIERDAAMTFFLYKCRVAEEEQ